MWLLAAVGLQAAGVDLELTESLTGSPNECNHLKIEARV